jgi:hypothetical protein
MKPRRYVRAFLIASFGFYLLLRVALAGYCSLALRFQDVETKNRLANIRILPKDGVLAAIETYCSRISADRNNVIFLGDSQTYGFNRPPLDTCAAALQQMPLVRNAGFSVHNLAIINGRHRDSIQILKALEGSCQKAACILLSTNPTHFIKAPMLKPDAEFYVPLKISDRSVFSSLIFTRENVFDLTGLSWRNTRKLHPVDLFDDLINSSESFVISEVGKTYCANLDPQSALPDLIDLIKFAKKNADRVIFYTQPRYYADYLKPPYEYDWNPQPVDEAVLATARVLKCDVVLDLSDAFPRDCFSDLIHLNRRGHTALAKTLLPHIIGGSKH